MSSKKQKPQESEPRIAIAVSVFNRRLQEARRMRTLSQQAGARVDRLPWSDEAENEATNARYN
jgi:hypothetical protein